MYSDNPETSFTGGLIHQLDEARRTAREYHQILDIVPDIVYKIDPDGYFTYLSKSIASLGYTEGELIGKHFSVIVYPEDLPNVTRKTVLPRFRGKETGADLAPKLFDERRTNQRMTKNLVVRLMAKKVPEGGETACQYPVTGEVCATGQYREDAPVPSGVGGDAGASDRANCFPKNGKIFYAEIANYGKYGSENTSVEREFLGTVGVIRDISDRKRLEKKQIELDQQILHSKKMEAIGILAGGIAHDFNNLLQGVFGYISMARLNLDQRDKCVHMLEQAEKALHMSVNLTKQLLTFSKGGKPLKKAMKILPIIENATKFALSGSRTDYSLENDAELRLVDVDEGQVGQVVQNIVMNADQAMPVGGTVSITVQNVDAPGDDLPTSLAAGSYIRISVKDNGIGIPEHYLPKIFDPYFTTKEKGSGLGLAASYSIIRNHGGMIDVKSEMGKGSMFSVYLPAMDAEERVIQPALAAETPVRKGAILLMDDEKMIRDVAEVMIQALGHTVEFAQNGEEAIDKYRGALSLGRPFDIVVLDLTIRGGMGGEETMQKLLEIDPDVKAVVSSGYAESSAICEYKKRGFKACLAKPYQVDTLRNTLGDLLK